MSLRVIFEKHSGERFDTMQRTPSSLNQQKNMNIAGRAGVF